MLEVSLSHQFDQFRMDLAFEGEAGSITSLFGRSGTGKTSVINMIAGLIKPQSGFIKVGEDVLFDSTQNIFVPPEKRRLGTIFQDDRLFPHLNVRNNLLYGAHASTPNNHTITFDSVVDVLDIVQLLERKPSNLSGGEKQRVAIGRALLSQPRLLLMDEPLASIDVQLRSEILPFIENLRDTFGLTVLYVSHAIEEVIRLADKMVVLSDGKKAAEGDVEEIMSRLDLHPLTGRFDAGAVLSTTVAGYEQDYELASLTFAGGVLRVTGVNLPKGTPLRAHIRARDVSLMLERPKGTSILNVFEGRIVEISDEGGPQLDLKIDIGTPLIARVTRKSFNDLGLENGKTVFAMIKAVAIDRRSLGGTTTTTR
ncbi:MAG: molybdenum ABC transporter ATP-binding protein [Rhodospirillales bacterium]|jgi:molybdate transport system ATP-binding protein